MLYTLEIDADRYVKNRHKNNRFELMLLLWSHIQYNLQFHNQNDCMGISWP